MDSNNKISVIIPVYNTEKYIQRCLESVLSNTHKNIEVICINDGSTDDSLSVLSGLAQTDDRIRIINQENSGVSVARNKGLEVMSGDFVVFVDSDDWIHPMYFETLLYFQEKTNVQAVACKWTEALYEIPKFTCFDKSNVKYTVLNRKEILNNNVAKRLACAHLYSASLVSHHYFETQLKNEEDIFFNISLSCKNPDITMTVVDQELYFYYKRLSSSSHTNKWTEKICLSKKYLECSRNSLTEEVQSIYLREACKAVLSFRYAQQFSNEYKAIKKECAKLIASCKRNMHECRTMSLSEKVMYHIFFDFPQTYRFFRIANDKTLLEMERNQKRKMIEQRDCSK